MILHRATLDVLMRTEGKAELIGGRIVRFPPLGHRPAVVIGRTLRSLAPQEDRVGGMVHTVCRVRGDKTLLRPRVVLPGRFLLHRPFPANPMAFLSGAPDFAVEVRSDWDYGTTAEQEQADKRADYFEAGTLVVWDVDPIAGVVRRYRPGEASPTGFTAGMEADAEPAVPGWRVSVDWLMRTP